MYRSLLAYRLKGQALFFVLVLSILIAVIIGSLLLIRHYHQIFHVQADVSLQMHRNARSGMALLLSEDPVIDLGQSEQRDLFGEGRDSVRLMRRSWGLYEVNVSEAIQQGEVAREVALVGYRAAENDDLALYMLDQNRPLRVSGRTVLKGTCKLPKAGIERDYVEGLSYSGTKLVYGKVERSTNQLPALDKEVLRGLEKPLGTREVQEMNISELVPGDTLFQSFAEPTLVIKGRDIRLNQCLKGNIVIQGSRSIEVVSQAQLEHVLLLAPFIEVSGGVEGRFQALANDSLRVGTEVKLHFPSALGLVKHERQAHQAFIHVDAKSRIEGVVFTHQNHYDRSRTKIYLDETSKVMGSVYADGSFDHAGTVYGSVICRKFSRRTSGGSYDNLLVNATIDRSKLSEHFVGSALIGEQGQKAVASWLE